MVKYEMIESVLMGVFDDLATLKACNTTAEKNSYYETIKDNIKELRNFAIKDAKNVFDWGVVADLTACISQINILWGGVFDDTKAETEKYLYATLESLLNEVLTIQDFLTPVK